MLKILDIAVIIFEMISAFMLFDNFLTIDKRKYRIIAKTGFVVIMIINSCINANLVITTIISLAAAYFGVMFYNGDLKSKIFCSLGFVLISGTAEYLVGAVLLIVNHIQPVELFNESAFRMVGMIASKIVLFGIIELICLWGNKKYAYMFRSYWLALLTIPIINLAIIISVTYYFETSSNRSSIFLLILMICIMYSNIISFYIFNKLIDSFETKMKNILLENQVNAQEKQAKQSDAENVRMTSIKHDFKNHLQIIDSMIDSNHTGEAKKYISELGIEKAAKECAVMDTGNLALDSIINSKIEQAKENDIEVDLNIKKLPCDLKLNGVECCMLLGNLFDNAIEGCLELEPTKRQIVFDIFFRQNQLFVGIRNSTCKQIEFVNGIPQTDKADKANHGIGLKNITEVVEKYNGIMRASCENGIYETNIVLFDV